MTYAEFLIRCYATKRMEVKEMQRLRLSAYTALIAPYQNYKKIPKTPEKFMPIDGEDLFFEKRKQVTEEHKQLLLQRYKEYIDKVNGRVKC